MFKTRRLAVCRQMGLILIVLLFAAGTASALPISIFVVHCEPTRANPMMWLELTSLVALADEHSVPLSIDFTPQWATIILSDPSKLAALESWIAGGHEIGCHHHGYWGTKDRGSTWDGYTNTQLSEIETDDRDKFLGTMDDYMALLNALPGVRRSGCLGGGSDSEDAVDYPCQIEYSTQGHALEHAVTQPVVVEIGDCQVIEIGHALIASQERGALQDLYLQTDDAHVFGVVGHVYNYADFPGQFEQWFAFLASLDEAGECRETVAGILDTFGGASRQP